MTKYIESLSCACFLASAGLPFAANASSALSPNITVDTRGSGNVNITGRVLNGSTNTPLEGATVSLAGQSTTSAANGTFTIANVGMAENSTQVVNQVGFLPQTRNVTVAAGQNAVNVGDMLLAAATGKPVVESAKPDVDGIFLAGFGLVPTLKVMVNWNGNTPGSVQVQVNGLVFAAQSGPGPEYSIAIPVDSALRTGILPIGNVISVRALAQQTGQVSAPLELRMAVAPVPAALRAVVNSSLFQTFGPNQLGFDFELKKHEQKVTLPLIGTFGFEWGANASFDYTIKDGAWELAAGLGAEGTQGKRGRRPAFPGLTRVPKAKLYIGNKEINVSINGKSSGTATARSGITFGSYGLDAGLEARLELTRYGLLDIFGPGLTNAISAVPAAGKILKNASITVWVTPALDGSATFNASPIELSAATLTGKIGLEGAYEPEIGDVLKGRVYIGSDVAATFGLPTPVFKNVTFRVYGGYDLTALWVFNAKNEVVWVRYSYPTANGLLAQRSTRDIGTGYMLEAASNKDATWRPMERPWREKGGEMFLASSKEQMAEEATAALKRFASMGEFSPQPLAPKNGKIVARVISSDLPTEAELPLLGNVFPDSDPALADHGNNLMLLYVRDTGAANALQFTEVAWTYFNGTTWTTPAPVAADMRGQFEPAVVFDGQGKAVGVWTRIKNAALAGGGLADMAVEMELVSATWNPETGAWGPATPLTDNTFLDHKPRLAGPLTGGDLILTWRENQANLLIGTGAAGAPQNTRVMTRRWDAATGTWGAASVLVADLANEMSDSLAAKGGKAVYALTRDLDGNLDDFNDSELYYRVWNEGTRIWGNLTRHTTDAINDRNVKLAIGTGGDAYCIWQRGDDLVMDVNFSGAPTIVRPDSGTFGFSDLALTVGSGGNVVVIWQEMGEHGSDAHYRVFDPASGTWGQDSFLSQDSDLERSFAPVWDAAGNLTLAYNNVQITKVTKNVVVEGGATVTVDGVPQPGQVDLLLAKRALVKDLAAVPEDLTADGSTFLPGDSLTLKARVKNSGNLAVQNVQVAFYDGDPANGGTLIETATIPGWLEAATEAEVTVNWTVPEPSQARTIHIKIDPASTVTESDEENNVLALPINGVDLALEYQSGSVLRDGSARVVVKVRNLSAPDAPVSTLRLKAQESATTLVETTVSQLAPGQSVDVPFDLPPGTQGVGDRSYKLTIDEEGLIDDIDRDNNEVLFALNLPIDQNGGFTALDAAEIRALPARWVIGEVVSLDLSFLTLAEGEQIGLTGLPPGLTFDPVTKRISGTVTGLLGEVAVEIRILDGSTIARALALNVSVAPHPFAGEYVALMETPGANPRPTGMIHVRVAATGSYTSTMNLNGQPKRSAKGSFTASSTADAQPITISFAAGPNATPPATVVQLTLPAGSSSDLVTGSRDGGSETLRGYRLAQPSKTPRETQRFTMTLKNTVPGDGIQLPAGTGSLTGTVDAKGTVRMAGFTGDAQPFTGTFNLSQTQQTLIWMQPYKNKSSYLGGMVSLINLDLPDRLPFNEQQSTGLKWFKQADNLEKAYPNGFAAQSLAPEVSRWISPANAHAMSAALGLAFAEVGVNYNGALPTAEMPSGLRLSSKYTLVKTAPNTTVPWTGKAVAASGGFSGRMTLPNGAGAVNGVFLQDLAPGASIGAGLVRVPLPLAPGTINGSFRTISIQLTSAPTPVMTDGAGGFSQSEEAALNVLETRFVIGETVDLDLSFLATTSTEKLVVTGLPRGLSFNALTKRITGTVLALLGESPVEIRVLDGRNIVRNILLNLSVSPHPFSGSYAALLESSSAGTDPTGMMRLTVTSTGSYTATMNLAGQSTRTAKGSFTAALGASEQTVSLSFLSGRNNLPVATTVELTLPALENSDLVSGNRDGGNETLRGFRLAGTERNPSTVQRFTLAMNNPTPGDGILIPAGTGTLTGTLDQKGMIRVTGLTGDAQAMTGTFPLSQTQQTIIWSQPYKNKASYLGGVVSFGKLGLPPKSLSNEVLVSGLKWSKQADPTEKAYPAGFAPQTLEAQASRWISPANPRALADSLALTHMEMEVSYVNPSVEESLPARLRLSEKWALIRIAPTIAVPWTGKATAGSGTFSSNLTFTTGLGSASGVFLQDRVFDSTVGAGLVRVPLAPGVGVTKGAFRTFGIELKR